MQKLNLHSFSYPELVAKLFCIQKDFNTNYPEIPEKSKFDKFVKNQAESHFFIPGLVVLPESVISHLSLFLLGNENNKFSKCINQNS